MKIQEDKNLENAESALSSINERRLMMKIDLRLLPMLCVMYMITFLDRVNIGNAAVLGMRDDLDMVEGTKYNAALMIFFIPYILFEIPSNILLRKLKPHVWRAYLANLGERLYLLGMWYKRSEAQKRYSIFSCSTILAGAFGGLLASAIGKMDGVRGYGGWRWVFILEGLATIVMAVMVYFALPDFPEDCKWLSEREYDHIRDKMGAETGRLNGDVRMGWRDIAGVFKDWKVFIGAFMLFGQIVSGYGTCPSSRNKRFELVIYGDTDIAGYAYFAPTIIRTFGYGEIKTQLYSVPPWAAAFGCTMLVATLSDFFRHRYAFTMIGMLIGIAGYGVLLSIRDTAHHTIQYGALFMITCGCFSASPVFLCWFGMNLGGHTRRSVGTAFQIGFGNIGGIIATYSFLEKDAPLYRNGYIIGLSFACLSATMSTVYFFAVRYENRKRERLMAQGKEVTVEEEERLGDQACTYRYAY
ncbi:major facilitator superfamily domain-containing protein [Aspergillus foveolatus]|uniref:major facilitator superfamily domain-containing protein n=1 Tax=Aspergillus foveolatus TaxID=210207 RepID=UPI003CCCA7F7